MGLDYSFSLHIRDTEGNTRRQLDDITVRLSMVEPGFVQLLSFISNFLSVDRISPSPSFLLCVDVTTLCASS